MQNSVQIKEKLYWVGGSDRRIALFESAFPVPRGVSYNSYVLLDEKTVVFDTVDPSVADIFLENVEHVLGGRPLDYLVVQHMEPDHSASFLRLMEKYPNATVVASQKAAQMLANYFPFDAAKVHVVKDGDTLNTGAYTLRFVGAPMIHWPEVLFTYVAEDGGMLFSADAFGTFGALGGSIFADEVNFEREFLDDARRYYFNIVGKYGVQVQNVLKKLAGAELSLVLPLHGPVWRKDIGWFVEKYDIWSKYLPEEKGVAVFYGSIYGHTQNAAEVLAMELARLGVTDVHVFDVSVTHVSELLAAAFRYSHLVFASATYNNGIFINMENFIADLKAHLLQNRKYAVIENGTWSPQAGALMISELSSLKNMTRLGDKVTVLSAVKEAQAAALRELAEKIAQDIG